jgi:hypothetical protein
MRVKVSALELSYIHAVWNVYDKIIQDEREAKRARDEMTNGDPDAIVLDSR